MSDLAFWAQELRPLWLSLAVLAAIVAVFIAWMEIGYRALKIASGLPDDEFDARMEAEVAKPSAPGLPVPVWWLAVFLWPWTIKQLPDPGALTGNSKSNR